MSQTFDQATRSMPLSNPVVDSTRPSKISVRFDELVEVRNQVRTIVNIGDIYSKKFFQRRIGDETNVDRDVIIKIMLTIIMTKTILLKLKKRRGPVSGILRMILHIQEMGAEITRQ